MELRTTFKVSVRCKHFKENISDESYSDKVIDLYLDETDAVMILFKFTPFVFKMSNGMIMYMKFSDTEGKLIAMILTDLDNEKYIILNPQQLWSEVLDAYEQIRLMEKLQVLSSISIPDLESENDE